MSAFTSHRAGEARTAAGAHRGPDVSGRSSPTRELRDQLLAMQRGHCRPIDGTFHRAGHRSNDVGAGHDRDRFLYKQQQLGGDQEPIRPTGTAADDAVAALMVKPGRVTAGGRPIRLGRVLKVETVMLAWFLARTSPAVRFAVCASHGSQSTPPFACRPWVHFVRLAASYS